jgi:hypothetical protein
LADGEARMTYDGLIDAAVDAAAHCQVCKP